MIPTEVSKLKHTNSSKWKISHKSHILLFRRYHDGSHLIERRDRFDQIHSIQKPGGPISIVLHSLWKNESSSDTKNELTVKTLKIWIRWEWELFYRYCIFCDDIFIWKRSDNKNPYGIRQYTYWSIFDSWYTDLRSEVKTVTVGPDDFNRQRAFPVKIYVFMWIKCSRFPFA